MPAKPEALRFGDTVGIASPASPPPDPKTIDRAVGLLERLGFQVKLAPNTRRRHGYLAGSDRQRAGDLMNLFTDRKVKAILCVRGGYGSARLLPLLDFRIIRANPKIFVGYSDITSLHCALLTGANLVSFHGPMLNSDFGRARPSEFALESLLRATMQPAAAGSLCRDLPEKRVRILRDGFARGELIGGNLSLLCTTVGTPYQPSFRGKILFLEDVGELPYRFDRMLTHLLNAGLLQQIVGVAIGTNRDCEDPKAKGSKEYRQTLDDVLKERLLPLEIPILAGLPFGHVPDNATLPVGVRARLDGDRRDLVVTSAAVQVTAA